MFNIFKKRTESIEIRNNNGMETFEGEIINLDDNEIESFTNMPEL